MINFFSQRRRLAPSLFVLLVSFSLGACGINAVIDSDENVKSSWSEVQNQYQRRADLIPNLIATIQGSANFEKETLKAVIEARSQATSIRLDEHIIDDPQRLKAFQEIQGKLSSALSRLLVVAEKYPELKTTAQFSEMLSQLEGTENRIAVARRRYIQAILEYNKIVLHFPSMIGAKIRGKEVRSNFDIVPGVEAVPKVKFTP